MSNTPDTPERNAPDPILPEPIGEDGLVQPNDETGGTEADRAAPSSPQPSGGDRPPGQG
ncbi:hypothetical protein [Aureimonas sp. ME7]|uniref:hypothetical protein n=1 Tax=Aureimonas sp. ME7 TaxID=2744252 RepID=UPI0015F4BF50|nr:hypothetical protein [Aureimonas sp. ME7]